MYVSKANFPILKKPTRVAAPSPRASLGRRTVCWRTERHRPPVSRRYETKVRMVWGSLLIAAAALKTPTKNGYNAQGVNLTFLLCLRSKTHISARGRHTPLQRLGYGSIPVGGQPTISVGGPPPADSLPRSKRPRGATRPVRILDLYICIYTSI